MEYNASNLVTLRKLLKYIMENKQLTTKDKNEIIKDLHHIQEAFEEIEKCDFKEIIEKLYDGIYVTDGEANTLYVNKAYMDLSGLKKEDVIGKNVKELLKKGVFYNAVTPEVIKNRNTINAIGKAQNGKEMLITGKPVFADDGHIKQVVVIDRDISELRRVQRELEISKKKIEVVREITIKKNEEIKHLREQQLNNHFVGKSEAMKETTKLINKVAPLDVTVLITGESGVGKEVVANSIVRNSNRRDRAFIKVNCAAIPANLLESELFGYEKGAFTNADTSKPGLFELADQGTLLLDEIGDMPLELQSKLLRAIQNKEISRVGGRKTIELDVRIIAATNANLDILVKSGKFREDLYYRLNIFPINILPLRSRPKDISELIRHFLKIYNSKYDKQITIEENAISMLQKYRWPGNIRELQNIIERLVIISDTVSSVGVKQISSLLMINMDHEILLENKLGLKETVENIERELIKKAFKEGGSTRKAAEILKISQSAVVKKSKKLGINLSE